VEKGNGFDLTGKKGKLVFEIQGTTEALLLVIRFGNLLKACVNKYDA